jgi:hypothetical protein
MSTTNQQQIAVGGTPREGHADLTGKPINFNVKILSAQY